MVTHILLVLSVVDSYVVSTPLELPGLARTYNALWAVCGLSLSRGSRLKIQQSLVPVSRMPWHTCPDITSFQTSNTGLTPVHLLCAASNICMAPSLEETTELESDTGFDDQFCNFPAVCP